MPQRCEGFRAGTWLLQKSLPKVWISVVGEKTYSDLKGLNEAWDADQLTRKRVRDHQRLLLEMPLPDAKPEAAVGAVAKTVDNCRYNEAQLSPLLKRMKSNRDCVPNIDVLMDEIEKTR